MKRKSNCKTKEQMAALLGVHSQGMRISEIVQALGIKKATVNARLTRALKAGYICKVGEIGQCLWGLEKDRKAMENRLRLMQYAAKCKAMRLRRDNDKLRRATSTKQRIKPADAYRRFKIPAVNSVWSLAA